MIDNKFGNILINMAILSGERAECELLGMDSSVFVLKFPNTFVPVVQQLFCDDITDATEVSPEGELPFGTDFVL
jgi:hypothetical protein